jgi:hypothetical protein
MKIPPIDRYWLWKDQMYNLKSLILFNSLHRINTNAAPSNVACCKLEALSAVLCIVPLYKTYAPDALQNRPNRKNSNKLEAEMLAISMDNASLAPLLEYRMKPISKKQFRSLLSFVLTFT